MHPHKKESTESHNAKMRRMTDGYVGSPANDILAPSERMKGGEGPEQAVGLGADATVPRSRADRASRKQMVANPVATLKRGGHVKRARGGKVHHRDSGGSTTADSPVEEANLNQSQANRARGGRTKHKGSTHVNVIVAPQGGGGPMGMRPPPVVPPGGPMVPPAGGPPPPMMPPGAAGMPPGAMARPMMAPGAVPPGVVPPRKHGGKVNHPDELQDKQLIMKTLKQEGLIRSNKAEKMPIEGRAMGGHVEGVTGPKGRLPSQKHHMTAGAVSGEGRLEKIGEKPKGAGKAQAV